VIPSALTHQWTASGTSNSELPELSELTVRHNRKVLRSVVFKKVAKCLHQSHACTFDCRVTIHFSGIQDPCEPSQGVGQNPEVGKLGPKACIRAASDTGGRDQATRGVSNLPDVL
jgi:hypothetical protein